jgi:hypothetical protein
MSCSALLLYICISVSLYLYHGTSRVVQGTSGPDVAGLCTVLQACPSVSELSTIAQTEGGKQALRNHLDALDVLLHPLLKWLISSNRSHLRSLPQENIPKVSHLYICSLFILE